ncbi:hypothetical protein RI129_009802 [Pyrocoelia pectoralis]|uniref:Uncharacterized protein n=1 Tax=Pyrocoelia pectoralis TaxID=417401 RepID=A0AAN7ZCL0_9COLE
MILQLFFVTCTMMCVSLGEMPNFDVIEKQCLNNLGYDEDIIKHENNLLSEDNEDMKTFFGCVWKEKGFQREDGSINFNSIYEIIISESKLSSQFESAYIAIQAIVSCRDVEGDDNGDTVIKVYNCLFEKVLEYDEEFKNIFVK